MTDPIASVIQFLRGIPDLATVKVTGDLNSREVGDTTVYVDHNGGFRVLRDCEDRIDIAIEVYDLDREKAAQLAFNVRDYLFTLRDVTVGGIYFLDAHGDLIPSYEPDSNSREHMYSGEVTLYYVAA